MTQTLRFLLLLNFFLLSDGIGMPGLCKDAKACAFVKSDIQKYSGPKQQLTTRITKATVPTVIQKEYCKLFGLNDESEDEKHKSARIKRQQKPEQQSFSDYIPNCLRNMTSCHVLELLHDYPSGKRRPTAPRFHGHISGSLYLFLQVLRI